MADKRRRIPPLVTAVKGHTGARTLMPLASGQVDIDVDSVTMNTLIGSTADTVSPSPLPDRSLAIISRDIRLAVDHPASPNPSTQAAVSLLDDLYRDLNRLQLLYRERVPSIPPCPFCDGQLEYLGISIDGKFAVCQCVNDRRPTNAQCHVPPSQLPPPIRIDLRRVDWTSFLPSNGLAWPFSRHLMQTDAS